jgi:hypothetical protein
MLQFESHSKTHTVPKHSAAKAHIASHLEGLQSCRELSLERPSDLTLLVEDARLIAQSYTRLLALLGTANPRSAEEHEAACNT